MNTKIKISSMFFAMALTGCATTSDNQVVGMDSGASDELIQIQEKNAQLQSTINQSNQDIQRLTELNRQLQSSTATRSVSGTSSYASTGGGDLLPPNAKPGECYARVLTPATYRTETKEVLKKDAGYRLKVIPATYETVTEKIMVKEDSEVAELIPATYDWRVESVLVKEAYDVLKTVPEVYETKSEKILVKPAYTTWKKGRGPIEKLNNSTGEIMCLIEVPAEYRTVTSRVLVTSARTERTTIPAVYKDVKKRVMVEPPRMSKRTIPGEYKTVSVKKVVTPPQEQRIDIPAEYQTVTNRVKVTDSFLEWRTILCETNTSGNVIRNLQRALQAAGYNPGNVDGVLGSSTMHALKQYQMKKNMAAGQLTIETLKSLGVSY